MTTDQSAEASVSGAEQIACSVCQKEKPKMEFISGRGIRESIVKLIMASYPDWKPEFEVCLRCVNRMRTEYMKGLLETEKGELTTMDLEVIKSLREQEIISENIDEHFIEDLSFGDKVSDKMANFGGSWAFILCFGGVIVVWIAINSIQYFSQGFDPYPFILLNLLLSCLAALQAPVIMMSQKRQESKDRLRSEQDYKTNLKAELEIRLLHMKMDQLLSHQWRRLLEIQHMQMEMMEDMHHPRSER